MFHQRKDINCKESPHTINEIVEKWKMFIWPNKYNILCPQHTLMEYYWGAACILWLDFSVLYGVKVNDRQGQ